MKLAAILSAACLLLAAQDRDIVVNLSKGIDRPSLALPDFRGAGDSQPLMKVFNDALWSEISDSGALKMIGKSLYPVNIPQRPEDFHPRRRLGRRLVASSYVVS